MRSWKQKWHFYLITLRKNWEGYPSWFKKYITRLRLMRKWHTAPVWTDWAIVWCLGNFLQPAVTISAQQFAHLFRRFLKVSFFYWKYFGQYLIDVGQLFTPTLWSSCTSASMLIKDSRIKTSFESRTNWGRCQQNLVNIFLQQDT